MRMEKKIDPNLWERLGIWALASFFEIPPPTTHFSPWNLEDAGSEGCGEQKVAVSMQIKWAGATDSYFSNLWLSRKSNVTCLNLASPRDVGLAQGPDRPPSSGTMDAILLLEPESAGIGDSRLPTLMGVTAAAMLWLCLLPLPATARCHAPALQRRGRGERCRQYELPRKLLLNKPWTDIRY